MYILYTYIYIYIYVYIYIYTHTYSGYIPCSYTITFRIIFGNCKIEYINAFCYRMRILSLVESL